MIDSWNPAVLNEGVQTGQIGNVGSDLPEVTSSDNGNVLTVVSGEWNKAEIPSQLPAVTSEDNGDVLKVIEGAWAKGTVSGYSPINYSTTEQNTGIKYGNDDVYQISFSGSMASGDIEIATFTNKNIVECSGWIKDGDGLGMNLGCYFDSSSTWWNALHIDTNGKLLLLHGTAVDSGTYFITVKYTKTT